MGPGEPVISDTSLLAKGGSGKVRHHLQALFDRARETVDISARHGREVTFLNRIVSDQELRVVPIRHRACPLHAMANGKAILACMADAEVVQLLRGHWPG